jgi:hypothetical protein
MKVIVFDSSSLISLAMSCLLEEFKELRKVFKGKFIITDEVKYEVIDRPLKIKRFQLEAMKLQQLYLEKILESPSALKINSKEIASSSNEILEKANSTFIGKNKEIHLIDSGEASCLAISKILEKKKIENVLAIDERTMRNLVENPEKLSNFLQKKFHTKIVSKTENFKFFKNFKIIRSAELAYVAWKKGLIKLKNPDVLDALLYSVKFKGCSISGEEIKEIRRMK